MAKRTTPAQSLSRQQELFCREYIIDLNATQAYIRAGYSPKGANTSGPKLLASPRIASRVQQLFDERANKISVNAETVLSELLRIARSDIRKLFDVKTKVLLSPDEWSDDVAAAVSSIEVDEIFDGYGKDRVLIGHTRKVKMWDKTRGLEMLGKHLKLFDRRIEEEPPVGPTVVTLQWDDGSPVEQGAQRGDASAIGHSTGDADGSATPDPTK